jgi:hypothetical protein
MDYGGSQYKVHPSSSLLYDDDDQLEFYHLFVIIVYV